MVVFLNACVAQNGILRSVEEAVMIAVVHLARCKVVAVMVQDRCKSRPNHFGVL